jgi:hypothetical protein
MTSALTKMTIAMTIINLCCTEIPVPFGRNIIARTPIAKKRYEIDVSNRLIQVAAVKALGVANKVDVADPLAGAKPIVKTAKTPFNDVSGALVRAYHEKVITKRSKTVTALSVSSNIGLARANALTFEAMKTTATIARKI